MKVLPYKDAIRDKALAFEPIDCPPVPPFKGRKNKGGIPVKRF